MAISIRVSCLTLGTLCYYAAATYAGATPETAAPRTLRVAVVDVQGKPIAGADVHVPFGGTKESGYGPHEQGRAAIEFYTEEVTVYRDV